MVLTTCNRILYYLVVDFIPVLDIFNWKYVEGGEDFWFKIQNSVDMERVKYLIIYNGIIQNKVSKFIFDQPNSLTWPTYRVDYSCKAHDFVHKPLHDV